MYAHLSILVPREDIEENLLRLGSSTYQERYSAVLESGYGIDLQISSPFSI